MVVKLGRLFVVATPIGNLTDISERALSTLREAGLIAAEDTRRTLQLLHHFSIKTPLISYHKFNENERGKELVSKLVNDNVDLALVTDAGTPCISDPGCIIVSMARENGIEVIVVPGPSAVISALSVCGFDYRKFTFMGFVPRDKKDRESYIKEILGSETDTFVMYESPNRIIKSLNDISVLLPSCRLFVINDITKLHEKSYFGTITEVISQLEEYEKSDLGEYTVVLQKDGSEKNVECVSSNISAEALLVDEMVRCGCTLKQAVENISSRDGEISKNKAYKASLEIKKLFT